MDLTAARYLERLRLLAFLDDYAATMSRVALRQCIEHLEQEQRKHDVARKPPA